MSTKRARRKRGTKRGLPKNNNAAFLSKDQLLKIQKACDGHASKTVISMDHLQRVSNYIRPKKATKRVVTKGKAKVSFPKRKRLEKVDELQKIYAEEDAETRAYKATVRERAQHLLDEQTDEAKMMNSLVLSSQCITVREKQLQEKERIKKHRTDYERKMDEIMELGRLQALEVYDERESKRGKERSRAALVLKKQIQEREKLREKDRQMKAVEQEMIKQHTEDLIEQEIREREKKKIENRLMMGEIAVINAQQILSKRKAKETEIIEDMKIEEYQKMKQTREERMLEEKKLLAQEKEMEIARIRARQKRAIDHKAAEDEKRAKRWMEENERAYRTKAKREALKRKKASEELVVVRRHQMVAKESKVYDEIEREKLEFEGILRLQQREMELEKELASAQVAKRRAHAEGVRLQIKMKLQEKDKAKDEFFEENRMLKEKEELEKKKLELIRKKKLLEMQGTGVPERFHVKLRTKQFKEKLVPGMRKSTGVKI